ncbi:MAG TPA: hypothetical protein VNX68_00465, partial [Nitrosopumilaceae archaeon]|nr:hypothetical protein [Nitrosopumilaceae archaeon]
MKTSKGMKFCESCQKNVIDLRRKSIDKIMDITSKGSCCVIIYDDQLEIAEERKKMSARIEANQKKTFPSALPYAAGIAALSLLPGALSAQETKRE